MSENISGLSPQNLFPANELVFSVSLLEPEGVRMDRTSLGDRGRLKEEERKGKESSRGPSERTEISDSLMNHG